MKTILIIDKDTMTILKKYVAAAPTPEQWGGELGSSHITAHVECPENIDADCARADLDEDEIIVISEDAALKTAKTETARANKLNKVREVRDAKLKRVDALVNVAFLNSWTAGEKTELKDYRQELLGITEPFKADPATLDALDVQAMTWPVEPTEA